jgi:hypothetical protein
MLNYNGLTFIGSETLKTIVESFINTDYENFEFMFVDNGSTDETYGFVESLVRERINDGDAKLIKCKGPGYVKGANLAAQLAKGELICIVNNDEMPLNRDWLKHLVKRISKDPSLAACASKKIVWGTQNVIDSCSLTVDPLLTVEQVGFGEVDRSQYDSLEYVLIYQTPVLIRKDVLNEIGGLYDEDFTLLHTDVDLSFRIWLAGWKIGFSPDSMVWHIRSGTMSRMPKEIISFHERKNRLVIIVKTYLALNLLKYLMLFLASQVISIILALREKSVIEAMVVAKAILWNIKELRRTIVKRRSVVRRLSDADLIHMMTKLNLTTMRRRALLFRQLYKLRKQLPNREWNAHQLY